MFVIHGGNRQPDLTSNVAVVVAYGGSVSDKTSGLVSHQVGWRCFSGIPMSYFALALKRMTECYMLAWLGETMMFGLTTRF